MKLIFLMAMLIALVSCKSYEMNNKSSDNLNYTTEFQQYMLNEINLVRTNPSEYAELRLKADKDRSTDNGSYQYLKSVIPVGILSINNSLHESASKYAMLLAQKNLFKHDADGTPFTRAIRNDYKGSLVGENIAAHSAKTFNAILNPRSAAVSFVRLLIIDQGVETFSHRYTILYPQFNEVGIGFGQDTTGIYVNYLVQDFGNL